jgi:ATP-dependent Clp protease ATP-binding subunit ClpC
MFERFTQDARQAVFFARYEAGTLGSQWIETHHLLLGILRERPDLAERWLGSRAALEEVRKEFERHFPARKPVSVSGDLPLSHQSKRALAYGAEEAERRSERSIQGVHLLMGLLREDSPAAQVLQQHGVTLEQLRAKPTQPGPAQPGRRTAARVALEHAICSLPEERLEAAVRILNLLQQDSVRIRVETAGETFTVSFGEPR